MKPQCGRHERGSRGTHLRPVRRERVHVHHVQVAREALVEDGQGAIELTQALDVRLECLRLIEKLGKRRSKESEAMRCVGVHARAGEPGERALRESSEGSLGRGWRHGEGEKRVGVGARFNASVAYTYRAPSRSATCYDRDTSRLLSAQHKP